MSNYVEFTLPDQSKIVMETDDDPAGVIKAGRTSGEIVQSAVETFENAVDNAQKAAMVILEKVYKDNSPDEVEITFGLKASGELGNLVIAKAGLEANYSVKLVWKRPEMKSNILQPH